MNETFLFLLLAAICLLIGAFIGNLFARLKNKTETSKLEERLQNTLMQEEKLNERLGLLASEKDILQKEKEQANVQLSRQSAEYEALRNELEKEKERFRNFEKDFEDKFSLLADKILIDKTAKFTESNKENIEGILKPLNQKIKDFEEKVGKNNIDFIKTHAELGKQLQFLNEQNIKISQEADNLTKALKGDSKIQGNWGEMILSRVLEESGLEKGREYTIQDSHDNPDGGRLQTDVIIHLPDGKKMIIDSKVSLTDFERYVSEENEDLKKRYLKDHIDSIKRHIVTLSEKKYYHAINESPDTIFMFVPIEPAFAIAVANQKNLYQEAFKRKVMIVTPSTLLAALRLVENLWENDNQKRNTLEIATEAGKLYDSFVGLLDELTKIKRQMGTVQSSFDSALVKLEGKGNLVRRVEKLRKLGAIASKSIDQKILKTENTQEELPEN
ncbi:DNA polymerase V [Aequorivita soesokkakensis]|jgi:DNA recombination protein RmuC|uniref:DNA polymerase V n=1 Tax=Aequorivita soesokkakensis TaxID=1385699 RepID=A0A1A9LHU9_9FLAO|nr:DNA recombination protein RmuC [Aequorivita soesokkakensis]OAD92677.1 DNA polymerase V [Aequorivita soesokkakensis]